MQLPTACCLLALACGTAVAQFDPQNNQWGKDDPADLRVMTFNVKDHLCSSNTKTDIFGSWNAMVRVIAAMEPDVIVFQEAGDNTGNGTGSGVDSPAILENVARLMFIGGTDPYRGNVTITSFVQAFRPGYDLPHVFVSTETDGFNRNVIVSRFPFADLDGDATATRSDIVLVDPDEWAPGGDGGIRGFMTAEIDLPDATYAGDLVIANAHLKAGGSSSDRAQRLVASQNASYYFYYQYFGAGGPIPDPNNKIRRGGGNIVLDDNTPIIIAGDLNEDESTNGRRGPADYLARGGGFGGSNGTDADQSDGVIADAREPFTNSDNTLGGSTLDYQIVSDSRATIRNAFIFDSFDAANAGNLPAELAGFPRNESSVSSLASDHLPVIVDYILEPAGAIRSALARRIRHRRQPPDDLRVGSLDQRDRVPAHRRRRRPARKPHHRSSRHHGHQLRPRCAARPLHAIFLDGRRHRSRGLARSDQQPRHLLHHLPRRPLER